MFQIFAYVPLAVPRLISRTFWSLWHLILFLFLTKTVKSRILMTTSSPSSIRTAGCENGVRTIRSWLLTRSRRGPMGCKHVITAFRQILSYLTLQVSVGVFPIGNIAWLFPCDASTCYAGVA